MGIVDAGIGKEAATESIAVDLDIDMADPGGGRRQFGDGQYLRDQRAGSAG